MTAVTEGAPTDQAESRDDWVWGERHRLLYRLEVTTRYHRRRQRFFDLLDKCSKAATVLLGATLFGNLLKAQQPFIAATISSLGLLALVFGYGDRKQVHKEMAEAAYGIEAKIKKIDEEKFDDERGFIDAEISALNAKEPPALKTLVIICEWETSVAHGFPNHVARPALWRRVVADFF